MELNKNELEKMISKEAAQFISDHINEPIYTIDFDNLDNNTFTLTNFDYVPLHDVAEEYADFINFLIENSGKTIEITLLTSIQNWLESNDIEIPQDIIDELEDIELFVSKDDGADEDDLYLVIMK